MVGEIEFNGLYNGVGKIGAGYAPAHITTIFEIHTKSSEPLKCGSRGIGFCIDKGVSTYVKIKDGTDQDIRVFLNNFKISGETTKSTIRNLIGNKKAIIEVYSYTELPMSQGFGLSGAGALSSAIALNSVLNLKLSTSELVNAAHDAEVRHRTGLGDVIAQATGGVVLRLREGGQNFGLVEKLVIAPHNVDVMVCVLGKELPTSEIISSKKQIEKINAAGKKYLSVFQKSPTLENLVELSYKFALETGLMDSQVHKAINQIHENQAGAASMIMLGNAIFAIGDLEKLETLCKTFGKPIFCNIDSAEAALIQNII